MMQQLDRWHKTRTGLLVFALVELGLTYGVASWALDSGNLLVWLLAIILFVGGVQNLIKLAGKLFRGKRQTSEA